MELEEKGITLRDVTKTFRGQEVLKGISARFEHGRIYGIVGRNGSGKSVMMKCICGLLQVTSGSIRVDGQEVGIDVDFPGSIGFIIENPGFLRNYSGIQNLRYLADIKGRATETDIRHCMEIVGLIPSEKKTVSKYSLGMVQRLGIAQAIMENPDILILDEPMNSLDNQGVTEMRNLFLKLRDEGKLIVIASHIREDIDLLCDEVYVMDNGYLSKIR